MKSVKIAVAGWLKEAYVQGNKLASVDCKTSRPLIF